MFPRCLKVETKIPAPEPNANTKNFDGLLPLEVITFLDARGAHREDREETNQGKNHKRLTGIAND
jgi:hypothetical protein